MKQDGGMVLVLTRSPKNISLFQNKFLCYFLLFTLATFVQIILNFGNFPKNLTISYWHLTKYLNFPPKILFIFSLFSHWLISWRECGWVRDMNWRERTRSHSLVLQFYGKKWQKKWNVKCRFVTVLQNGPFLNNIGHNANNGNPKSPMSFKYRYFVHSIFPLLFKNDNFNNPKSTLSFKYRVFHLKSGNFKWL